MRPNLLMASININLRPSLGVTLILLAIGDPRKNHPFLLECRSLRYDSSVVTITARPAFSSANAHAYRGMKFRYTFKSFGSYGSSEVTRLSGPNEAPK